MSGNQVDNKFLAQQNLLNNVIKPMILNEISNNKKQTTYPATVKNVYDNSMTVDVQIDSGNTPTILEGIVNRTSTVLSVGDIVELSTGTSGDISNCYISRNYNDVQSLIGENIVGVLSFGNKSNSNGEIVFYDSNTGGKSINIQNYSVDFFDWLKTNLQIGSISCNRNYDSNGKATGSPVLAVIAEKGSSIALSTRNDDNISSKTCVEISNNAYSDGIKTNIHTKTYIDADNTHAIHCQPDANGGNQIYGNINFEGWSLNSIGNINCNSITVNGSKSGVEDTQTFGKVLSYAEENVADWRIFNGFGTITKGQCLIYIDPVYQEIANLKNKYIFKFYPDESCEYKIEKHPTYVLITANKDIEFSYEIKAKRLGHENKKYESLNNIQKTLSQPNEKDITSKLKGYNSDINLKNLMNIENKQE